MSAAAKAPEIPADIMRELRHLVPPAPDRRGWATQDDIAQTLAVGRRTVARWERVGGTRLQAWALVGWIARFDSGPLFTRALHLLVQAGLPGSDVWGRGSA